jgi:hypothetical protein
MKILSIAVLILMCCGSAQAGGPQVGPCYRAYLAHIPCVFGVTDNPHWRAQSLIPASLPINMPWQGNTLATVEAQFPTVINWEFATRSAAGLNATMALVNDLDLARFAHFYWIENHGDLSLINMYAAQKLTVANLIRWRAAFGVAEADLAIATYASPAVKAEFARTPGVPIIKQSLAARLAAGQVAHTLSGMPTGTPVPNTDMTLREIYSEYLFNGANSQGEAFGKMVLFASGRLGFAWSMGYKAGTKYYAFAEKIDPSYGFDLTTTYGDLNLDFGPIDAATTGRGYLNDSDITYVESTEWCEGGEPC